MADALISKDHLRMCLDEFLKLAEKTRNEPGAGLMVYAMDGAETAIRSLRDKLGDFPTVDAVPMVHGRWLLGVPITCSACGKPAAEYDSPITFWESPYCPWCGAKMDLKEEKDG